MRTPGQYLAPAFTRLQSGPLRDCSTPMRWGERVATVSRIGSPRRGDDAVSEYDIPEECRVLAPVAPFCGLAKGDAVELGGTFRVVTSATDNITRSAFFSVGLSAAFSLCRAAYSGTRRTADGIRKVEMPLDVLTLELSEMPVFADAAAPSTVQTWIVCVAADQWGDSSSPEIGDVIEFSPPRDVVVRRFNVATATHQRNHWTLRVRPRGVAL